MTTDKTKTVNHATIGIDQACRWRDCPSAVTPPKAMPLVNLKTLGEKFIELSVMFLAFIKEHNLDSHRVYMDEGEDTRDYITPLCETYMCHGGWLAVMFEKDKKMQHVKNRLFYKQGAARAAKFLGFGGVHEEELTTWARENPALWGNGFGAHMFSDARAFGVGRFDTIPFTKIANHYAAVGKRCLESSEK